MDIDERQITKIAGAIRGRRRETGIDEHHSRTGIAQDCRRLCRGVIRVERDRDRAVAKDAEVGGAPRGVVVRENRAAIAGGDALRRQPIRAIDRGGVKLTLRPAVGRALALQLDRRAIGEARCCGFEHLP